MSQEILLAALNKAFLSVATDGHSVDVEWPVTPISAIVVPSCDYPKVQGEKIKAADMSLRAIIWAAHQYHQAYSGTMCASMGVRALMPGTVVNEVLADEAKKTGEIKIAHPAGIRECDAEVEMKDGQAIPKTAASYRTARRITEGYVYLKPWAIRTCTGEMLARETGQAHDVDRPDMLLCIEVPFCMVLPPWS